MNRGSWKHFIRKIRDCMAQKEYRKLAYSAGTKHPHMAITVSRPICRKYVLFPLFHFSSKVKCSKHASIAQTGHAIRTISVFNQRKRKERKLTLGLEQFETKKTRSNRCRWVQGFQQTARPQGRDDDQISQLKCP